MILTFKNYIDKINEGLIKTYDIDFTIKSIENELNSFNLNIDYIKNSNLTFYIFIDNFYLIDNSNVENILDYLLGRLYNQFGWFPSELLLTNLIGSSYHSKFDINKILPNKRNLKSIRIKFESKYDKVNNIPNRLYHLSIQEYTNSILALGLCPKSKSKLTNHDYRIYVCDNEQSAIDLIPKMKSTYLDEKWDKTFTKFGKNDKYKKNTKWIIYEIDTTNINITNLYSDPNYTQGYYLLDNIPPSNITIKLMES